MAEFGKGLARKLDKAAHDIRTQLDKAMLRAGLVVAGQAQKNVTGGGSSRTMLNVRTGRLRSSLTAVNAGYGRVKVGTNVIYARIHEEGGMIFPTRGKWLRFKTVGGWGAAGNQWHTVDRVRIPARPYLGPALEKMRPRVIAIIRKVYSGTLFIGGREE